MFDDFQDFDEQQEDDLFGSSLPPAIDEGPEKLLPPRESSLCLGHQQAEQTLLDLINSGNMPHAIIFSGPHGIGKSTMAFRLARYLLKNGIANNSQDSHLPAKAESLNIPVNDPVSSRVTSGGHPDFLTIERPMDAKKGIQKTNLDVETARKVAPFLRMTSADGGWRVVIIDDADSMNRNAQNALLKILEEPPARALLILITHRLGAMIPTIRSRCRVLHFNPLSKDVLAQLMEKEIGGTLSPQDQKLLSALAGGSIGIARKIISSGGLETAQTVLALLEKWPDFNWVDIHHLAENATRTGQEESFINIERTFLWFCEEIIFARSREQGVPAAPLDDPSLQNIMSYYPLKRWLEIYEELKAHFNQIHYANLDKRQGILGAFSIFNR